MVPRKKVRRETVAGSWMLFLGASVISLLPFGRGRVMIPRRMGRCTPLPRACRPPGRTLAGLEISPKRLELQFKRLQFEFEWLEFEFEPDILELTGEEFEFRWLELQFEPPELKFEPLQGDLACHFGRFAQAMSGARPIEIRIRPHQGTGQHVVCMRGAGQDGKFSSDSYSIGSFPPGDPNQDIVWCDGRFVRRPEKAVNETTGSRASRPGPPRGRRATACRRTDPRSCRTGSRR